MIEIMNQDFVKSEELSRVVHMLHRCLTILKLMISQFDVLETMTALNFMDFRDFLFPASGFQSYQFRIFEHRLGLKPRARVTAYHTQLSDEHVKIVGKSEIQVSLFDAVEKWLERTPFVVISDEKYHFIEEYKQAVNSMFDQDISFIKKNTEMDETSSIRQKELEKVEESRANFLAMFDKKNIKLKLKIDQIKDICQWKQLPLPC